MLPWTFMCIMLMAKRLNVYTKLCPVSEEQAENNVDGLKVYKL